MVLKTLSLFLATALAEILGCYLFYLWFRQSKPTWVLLPSALSLGIFTWLLALHPMSAGRTYAAYGGIYVFVALLWLWMIEGQQPDRWDFIGGSISLVGMAMIVFGPR